LQEDKVNQLEASLRSGSGATNPVHEELTARLEEENKALVDELEKLRKDQDELLELLTEQDSRIAELKSILRDNGVEVNFAIYFMILYHLQTLIVIYLTCGIGRR